VDKLSTLVAQLLDISRIESGELELERRTVDLVPLVRGMIESMQAGATRHTLSLHAPEAVEVLVDPLRLEEVLYNLLDNAIRYSPRGGPVEVELSTPDPKTVRLVVRDHGIGVPPEQRERLFTRFFQAARRPAGGLGLGLYISRRIVELHGGRIWAEFPEDGGSRFVVEVPREGAW
jgi:two-component system sensor histidine kinase VicK